MEQEQNQPEKKIISGKSKTFIVAALIIYLAAMAYVGYFIDGKVDASAISRMTAVLAGGITITVITFRKNSMKW